MGRYCRPARCGGTLGWSWDSRQRGNTLSRKDEGRPGAGSRSSVFLRVLRAVTPGGGVRAAVLSGRPLGSDRPTSADPGQGASAGSGKNRFRDRQANGFRHSAVGQPGMRAQRYAPGAPAPRCGRHGPSNRFCTPPVRRRATRRHIPRRTFWTTLVDVSNPQRLWWHNPLSRDQCNCCSAVLPRPLLREGGRTGGWLNRDVR